MWWLQSGDSCRDVVETTDSDRCDGSMIAARQPRLGVSIRCRLCWRIALAVFASILAVEAIVLIPSYVNYKRDLLLGLEDSSRTAVITGLRPSSHASDREKLIAGELLTRGTRIEGGTLYDMDGRKIGSFGEVPRLTLAEARTTGIAKAHRAGGERYEVLWLAEETGLPVIVAGRLDTSWIDSEMVDFVWRIVGLVLMISVFVSGAAMIILSKLILRPMLSLRAHLVAAQQNPENAERYMLNERYSDEIGEMVDALNNLLDKVSKSRHDDLQEREVRFKDFADAASDWFWEMDQDLRFSYFSDRFTEITNVPQEKLLGKTRQETKMAGVDGEIWQAHLADLAAHRPFRNFAHPRTGSDGEVRWLSISGSPVFDGAGTFKGYRGVGSDITPAWRMEDALRTAKDMAEIANRTKSEFLAAMSHELRTPLNAINGFSQIIRTETFGPVGNAKYLEYAKDIQECGQHLNGLINDILDLSKIESGKDELYQDTIEIPDIVRSVLTLVGQRAEQGGIEIQVKLPDQLPALRADERKLKQILVNLLSNAIKFTDAGGEVSLSVWYRIDSGYMFQIADTGIGIAPENLPKALSRFGQVDADLNRHYEGTGLGLPLCKALVEQHGGTLDLQSEVGVGTTVTVRFPAVRIIASSDNPDSLDLEGGAAS